MRIPLALFILLSPTLTKAANSTKSSKGTKPTSKSQKSAKTKAPVGGPNPGPPTPVTSSPLNPTKSPTGAPVTAPPTMAPVTAPPTMAPVTAPPTMAPVTPPPTSAPVTMAPATASPVSLAPVTIAPTSFAPISTAPTSHAPVATTATAKPTTLSPVTVSPTTYAPVTTSPTSLAFLSTPGRCAWTQPDCESLHKLIYTMNHPDVSLLHTEICQAFATLSPPQYPSVLHCPSGGHEPVAGEVRRVNKDDTELNAATGWSTCGGDLTIKKGVDQASNWYEYNLHAYVHKEFKVSIDDALTKCPQLCRDDPLCKFAFWNSGDGQIDLGLGNCMIFHESDTLSPDSYWRNACGWTPDICVDSYQRYLFAKCDDFNVNPTTPTTSPTPSPVKAAISSGPTVDPLASIPGRCSWTEPDCQALGKAINVLNQHPDVDQIHTGICQAFADMGHYPVSLHCPSTGHQTVQGTVKRIDNAQSGELTPSTNYTTCGGGIKIAKGSIFYEWQIHGVIYNTIPMLLFAVDGCAKACTDDPLCKYSMWIPGQVDLKQGMCNIFHESDTLTSGSYWTQPCSVTTEDVCLQQGSYVYAKCDDFHNPSSSTNVPTSSPTNAIVGTTNSPTGDIFTPVKGRCAWTQPECLSLQSVINHATQQTDVAILHTELCQAFAALGQYPASLHCPSSGHQNVTGTLKRVDRQADGELTAASNYTTCGGGLKLAKSSSGLMEWNLAAKVANTVPMDISDAETLCLKACNDDPFCKYSAFFQRTEGSGTGAGDCLVFHESDTLTAGTHWTRVCGFDEVGCMSSGTGTKIFAKCDNFNNP